MSDLSIGSPEPGIRPTAFRKRYPALPNGEHPRWGLDQDSRTPFYKSDCTHPKQARYVRRLLAGIGSYEYKRVPCRRWSCAACGPEMRLPLLRNALEQAIPAHELGCYATLTIPGTSRGTAQELSKAVTKAVAKLMRRYAKKSKAGISYIWIKELKRGRPHLHLFLPGTIKRKLFKKLWFDITGAKQVKFKPIQPGTVAELVGYNTKGIIEAACLYATSCGRWYSTSRSIRINIDRPERENTAGWTFVKGRIDFGKVQAQVVDKDRLGYPVRFLTDIKAPPRRLSSIPSRAAVAEGSEGAQPPMDPKAPAARAAGDEHAPGTVTP